MHLYNHHIFNNKNFFSVIIAKFHRLDKELRLFILAVVVGLLGGLGTVILRFLIAIIFLLMIYIPMQFFSNFLPGFLVFLLGPAIGGVVVTYLLQHWMIDKGGHGVAQIINSVENNNGRLSYRYPFLSLITSALTLGSGGSAGREGPIVQIGGGFGSLIGQVSKVTLEERKHLVIAGVSAGIASTFNAPIGGLLFAYEVFKGENKSPPLMPLIVSSVVGTVVGIIFLGPNPSFIFPTSLSFHSVSNVPLYIGFGVIFGFVSVIWIRGFHYIGQLFKKIKNHPFIIAAFGGLLVGIMYITVLFYNSAIPLPIWVSTIQPVLNSLGIAQNSILAINSVFARKFTNYYTLLLVSSILFVLGFLCTAITIGSTESGGNLAPTLFLGVMAGGIFSSILNILNFPNDMALLAVLGMAGFLAGTMKTPLTAIILTAEMVGNYLLIIPLMFTVSSAWIVSREIFPDDIYSLALKNAGIHINKISFDILEHIPVMDIMAKEVISVDPKDRLEYVLQLMERTGHTGFPVVDDGKLTGMITEHDIAYIIKTGKDIQTWVVKDCANFGAIESVLPTCPVNIAISIMSGHNINRLPVIDGASTRKLIGLVTRSDVVKVYFRMSLNYAQDRFEDALFEEKGFVVPPDKLINQSITPEPEKTTTAKNQKENPTPHT